MTPPKPQVAAALSALALGLALLLKSGGETGLVVQFVLGKLAYSTSDGAALFLLVFGLVAVWRLQLGTRTVRHALPVFACCLLLGHGINLWLALRYLAEMQIPLGHHVYHWLGSQYSFTGLFHSHLGKAAFAVPAQALGWQVSGYDTGAVFAHWVPVWAAWVLAAAFIAGCVAFFLALTALARSRPAAQVAVLVIASALTLRAMLDGGPLSAGIPFVTVALAWSILSPWKDPRTPRWFWLASGFAMLAYLVAWLALSPALPGLGGVLFPTMFFLWLAQFGVGKQAHSPLAVRLLLMVLLATMLALDADDTLLPMVTPLAPGCQAVSFAADPPHTLACAGMTALQVYHQLGEDPRKPKATLIMQGGMESGQYQLPVRLLVVDASRSGITLRPSISWEKLALQPFTAAGGWLSLTAHANTQWAPVLINGQANAISRNNFNVYLWELARVLREAGLSEFILLPQTSNNQIGNRFADGLNQ